MQNDFSNIVIFFKDDAKNSPLFNEYSTSVDESEMKDLFTNSLNLEGFAIFKKTPLVDLIDRFSSKVVSKLTDDNAKLVVKFIAFILLNVADPSFLKTAKRLKIFDGDLFTNIEPLFKRDAFGRKYFSKDSPLLGINTEDLDNLLQHLINDNLLVKEENNYFINDEFVLMSAKIRI